MENTEVQLDGERSPEAQAIIDAELGVEHTEEAVEEDELTLPSDDGEEAEPVKLAGKYNSVEELKKGIVNIGSNLPEYVIDGMSDAALEQHYNELQKTTKTEDRKPNRKFAEPKKEEVKPDEVKDDKAEEKPSTVSEELWSELDAQFSTSGNITSEQYDKLNEAGIPDSVIDGYLDGLKNQQLAFTEKIYNIAGGEEQYNEIRSWAENGGISEAELGVISNMKDFNQIALAMEGVKARYDAVNNSKQENQPLRGSTKTNSSKGYQSEADYLADVRDPRYGTDKRFQDKVRAKLSRSNLTEG